MVRLDCNYNPVREQISRITDKRVLAVNVGSDISNIIFYLFRYKFIRAFAFVFRCKIHDFIRISNDFSFTVNDDNGNLFIVLCLNKLL